LNNKNREVHLTILIKISRTLKDQIYLTLHTNETLSSTLLLPFCKRHLKPIKFWQTKSEEPSRC